MKYRNIIYRMVIFMYLVILLGCNKLNEGYVIKKIYEPKRTYIIPEYNVVLNIMETKIKCDDEDWYLVIEGIIEQDTLTRTICVNHETYEQYNIGDYLVLD